MPITNLFSLVRSALAMRAGSRNVAATARRKRVLNNNLVFTENCVRGTIAVFSRVEASCYLRLFDEENGT